MKTRCTSLLGASALALAVVGLPAHTALARSVTPLSGMPWVPADQGCFSSSWNQLTNSSCYGPVRKWLFDAPVDTSNNYHSIAFYGIGGGFYGEVKCWATSNNAAGTSGWSGFQSRSALTWGAMSWDVVVWVPSGGNLHADCDIPVTAGISAFNYAI